MAGRIRYHDWRTAAELDLGTHEGTAAHENALVIDGATQVRPYVEAHRAGPHRDNQSRDFEQATWVSPEITPGFPVTEVIASWNATTPAGTWLEVEVAATTDDGSRTRWYVLGRWAESDHDICPTSVPAQHDGYADVAQDTLRAAHGRAFSSYRLRVNLLRAPGSQTTPAVRLVGAMGSNVATDRTVPRSPSGGAEGVVLDVPAYSQMLHRGEYPQWDNGGASWCSPTSTMMLLAHWGRGPSPADYAWVDAGYRDRFVDYAARHTYDHDYGGAGNWPFNTAFAARYGVVAYVTRLRDLTEAERFIRAGIPLVASMTFARGQLEGAGYDTEGHLLTVVGFDKSGDVVSNDPASHAVASNEQVRTTYRREQFENAWMIPGGGLVYVIVPPGVAPPEPPEAEPNWR